jgi:hypothetical protein
MREAPERAGTQGGSEGTLDTSCSHARKMMEIREAVFGIATAAAVADRWLRMDVPDIGEARQLLKTIMNASERATTIIGR